MAASPITCHFHYVAQELWHNYTNGKAQDVSRQTMVAEWETGRIESMYWWLCIVDFFRPPSAARWVRSTHPSPTAKNPRQISSIPKNFAAFVGDFWPLYRFPMLFFSCFLLLSAAGEILSFCKLCLQFPLVFGATFALVFHKNNR